MEGGIDMVYPRSRTIQNPIATWDAACYSAKTTLMPTSTLSREETQRLYDECVDAIDAQYKRNSNSIERSKRHKVFILAVTFAVVVVVSVYGIIVIREGDGGNPAVFFLVLGVQALAVTVGSVLALKQRR